VGSLLNRRRRKGGGGSRWARPCGGWRGRDRRGPWHGGRQRGAAGSGPDYQAWAVSLLREQGRAAGRGRRGAGVTDRRDQGEVGSGVNGGVRERAGERGWAVIGHQ
jgi:hypothetical protein